MLLGYKIKENGGYFQDKMNNLTCPKCHSKEIIKRGLIKVYYNWVRNHQALEKKTPSELACPNVQIENKNGWLELIERGYYEQR